MWNMLEQFCLTKCCSLQEKAAASGAAREAAQAAEEVWQILHWHVAVARIFRCILNL